MNERSQVSAGSRAERAAGDVREDDASSSRRYPRVQSSTLFGESPCLVIEHGQDEYRLRITRLGKLILTK